MKVSLHLTSDCNLRCDYCYTGEKSRLAMSEETAAEAVDFLLEEAGADPIALTFFGGEPLLALPIIESVVARFAQARKTRAGGKVSYAIVTNGTLLTEKIAQLLVAERFHVFVSVDGTPEAHDRHRVFKGGKGSAFAVEKNLASLLALNPFVVTLSVISPDNAHTVADTARHLIEKDVRFLMLTPDYRAEWNEESFGRLEKAYRELAKLYAGLHRRGTWTFINLFDDRIHSHLHPGQPVGLCEMGDSEFSIAPDGTIYPCVQFINADTLSTGRHALGHVREGWNLEARRTLIAAAKETPASCVDCALDGRCSNYCGCLNFVTTGEINEVSAFRCTHERMLFPIVDRTAERLFKEKNALFLQRFYDPLFSLLSALELAHEKGHWGQRA